MHRFIFFTKTNWDETPRLRHQLASLLKDYGHEIIFFQKPNFFWQKPSKNKFKNHNLEKTTQLIHHQFRFFESLSKFNAITESFSISRALEKYSVTPNDIVLNFNYDYYFLRDLFPKNQIFTIINDDFVAQSKFFNGRHVKRHLSRVCSISNAVLTVSEPLKKQLSEWSIPILFLPWSETDYTAPIVKEKNSLLIWASINKIIDCNLLDRLAKKFKLVNFSLIGPTSADFKKEIDILISNNNNITLSPPQSLNEINFNHYFASILPYKRGNPSTEAVTLANKSLRLMSKGLPLIVHGMPHFLEHKAIFKCSNFEDVCHAIENTLANFWGLQGDIKNLVDQNCSEQRYQQLMTIVNRD